MENNQVYMGENTLTENNYPLAIQTRVTLVYKILNAFYSKFYSTNLEYPFIEISSDSVSTYPSKNILNTNYDQLSNSYFCDIGITLAIAHEMGHIITNKTGYIDYSKKLNLEDNSFQNFDRIIARAGEKIADIISGYVLKKLEIEGYLIPEDIEDALENYYQIGTQGVIQSFFASKINIHGTGQQRRERINIGYNLSDEELHEHLNSSVLPTYSLIDDLRDIKCKIFSLLSNIKKGNYKQ